MFPVVTFRLTARSRRPSPSLVIAALRPREVWPVVTVHKGLSPASRRLRYSAPHSPAQPEDAPPADQPASGTSRGVRRMA